jgi:hypothetical protein
MKEGAQCRSRAETESTSASSPEAAQTLPLQCFQAWHSQQGWVKGRTDEENARVSVIAYRFCIIMQLSSWPACRVILTAVRLLLACYYQVEDIEVCFAKALAMLKSPRTAHLMKLMGPQERVLVAVLHVYCAHSLVFDEFIHFNIWHEWLLAPFCSLKTGASALKKVCALRKWRFVVPPMILEPILDELRHGSNCDDSDYEGSLPDEDCH